MTRTRALLEGHMARIILVLTAAVVIYLAVPPIAVILFSTVRSTQNTLPFEATSFTFANFVRVFSSSVTYEYLLNTVWYVVGTVGIALTIAVVFSWFLERTNMPLRRLFFVLTLMPMGIPGIVLGMSWILLANPSNGMLNVALRGLFGLDGPGPLQIYSIWGMIAVTAMRFVPLMYLMISGVFARIDPSLEEAGSTSGARPWLIFRRISIPLLAPAILAALIYFVVLGIEAFETAGLLGFPNHIFVFSTAIYWAIYPPRAGALADFGTASTYGLLLLAAAAVLIYAYRRYTRRTERFVTVTGRGYRPRLIDLGKWRYVPVIVMSVYFLIAVVMPLIVLLWRAFSPAYATISISALGQLSLNAFQRMAQNPALLTAAMNTVIIGIVTACVTMTLVTLVSWLSVRRRGNPTVAVTEYLAFLILGVPGIVLALALIFIYASFPIRIYGTIWIIILGLVTLTIPFGTRLMTAALLQIHKELEEAAETSGANPFTTLIRIVLPLLWPSFLRGFLWVFVSSICNATVPLMLQAYGNQTITVALWNIWFAVSDFPLACAMALPLVVLSLVLALLVGRQSLLVGSV
jgi:iron(III) transport system permease protein